MWVIFATTVCADFDRALRATSVLGLVDWLPTFRLDLCAKSVEVTGDEFCSLRAFLRDRSPRQGTVEETDRLD